MDLFLHLKELFNKNIDCGEDMNNHIVFFMRKKKCLYINKNIMVRDGSVCVIVYKHRVRDVLLPGKYKIGEQSIPETYAKAHIDRKNKKGAKVRKIRANIYYVNTNEIKSFDFTSNMGFSIKSRETGRVKGLSQGICTLRVIDPAKLIKTLLNYKNKVKSKDAFKIVGWLIGNKINKRIQKDKISVDMIFNNHEHLNKLLNTGLEDAYDNIGVFVKNIKLKSMNFSKRSQKKINNYLVTHKKVFNASTISNKNWSVRGEPASMVTRQVGSNSGNAYIVCARCGFKNSINATSCRNCNIKF